MGSGKRVRGRFLISGRFGLSALTLAVGCLSLSGCSGSSFVQTLASLDATEIERHDAPPGMAPRRGEPGTPALLSWSQFGEAAKRTEHPRLEMAAMLSRKGTKLMTAQVSPFLNSRLLRDDLKLASAKGEGILIRAKSPAKIINVQLSREGANPLQAEYGPAGTKSAVLNSPIQTGETGRLKVTLSQPSFSSANVVLVSPGRPDSEPRFRLSVLNDKGGRVQLQFSGSLAEDDCPHSLQARTAFGRQLPLKIESVGPKGIAFSMDSSDYRKAWIVILPKDKVATLDLPLSLGEPQPALAPTEGKAPSPLVRVIHEDPNKVDG